MFQQTNLRSDPSSLQRYNDWNSRMFGWATTQAALPSRSINGSFKAAQQTATSIPGMMYEGTPGLPGRLIDTNSELLYGAGQRAVGRQNVESRAFASTPFFGFAQGGDVDQDSKFKFKGYTREPRSIGTISDRTQNYWQAPLISDLKSELADPKTHIQEAVDPTWIRGGVDTRMKGE